MGGISRPSLSPCYRSTPVVHHIATGRVRNTGRYSTRFSNSYARGLFFVAFPLLSLSSLKVPRTSRLTYNRSIMARLRHEMRKSLDQQQNGSGNSKLGQH